MNDSSVYAQLQELVEFGDYAQAEVVCRAALARGEDPQFWETQLGYVCFLNERDAKSYYDKALATFTSLTSKYSSDDNARFWLAYIFDVIFSDLERARQELHDCLQLNPNHSYAKLVLAGIVDQEQGKGLLRKVLQEQPTNFRALRQLADALIAPNQGKEARRILDVMLHNKAYVEQAYGIMNRYMNDVLTNATHEHSLQEEARTLLRQLDGVSPT